MIVYAIPYFFSRHSFPLCLKVVPIEYFQLQTGQISSITILYSVLLIVISVYYQMVYDNSEKLLVFRHFFSQVAAPGMDSYIEKSIRIPIQFDKMVPST